MCLADLGQTDKAGLVNKTKNSQQTPKHRSKKLRAHAIINIYFFFKKTPTHIIFKGLKTQRYNLEVRQREKKPHYITKQQR